MTSAHLLRGFGRVGGEPQLGLSAPSPHTAGDKDVQADLGVLFTCAPTTDALVGVVMRRLPISGSHSLPRASRRQCAPRDPTDLAARNSGLPLHAKVTGTQSGHVWKTTPQTSFGSSPRTHVHHTCATAIPRTGSMPASK